MMHNVANLCNIRQFQNAFPIWQSVNAKLRHSVSRIEEKIEGVTT